MPLDLWCDGNISVYRVVDITKYIVVVGNRSR